MHANVTSSEGRVVIRLEGRFDFSAHREFREAVDAALKETAGREMVVDLSNVEYLDSSALGMLLMLRDRARGAGRAVSLANGRGAVKQVLEIANFNKLFPIA